MIDTAAHDRHGEQLAAIERLFLGRLPPREAEELYAHLRRCPACERAYEQLAAAESALFPSGQDRAITPFARDRIKDRLFTGAPQARPAASRSAIWSALIGSVAAAAIAAFVVFVPADGDQFIARGTNTVKLSPQTGLRVLGIRGLEVSELGGEKSVLRSGDQLQLLVTNLGSAPRFVTAAILAGDRELARIGPVEVAAGREDLSFGDPIEARDWPEGQLTAIAVFSAEPSAAIDFSSLSPSDEDSRAVRASTFTFARGAAR